tara:strand:- start:422 stop:1318 length:897 start_codon:yes stop_codon:yes gene_type:complete
MLKLYNLIFFFIPTVLISQELNCRVIVNAQAIQSSDPTTISEMEIAFSEFLNNTKWTSDQFKLEERINCNIILTLNDQSNPALGEYQASVQVLSSRPIYNTDYETILLNFADRDWTFEYVSSQPIIYNENSFIDNLSSLLSYYALVIIGLDYDSFGKLRGEAYFNLAWRVVTNAQNSGFNGWDQFNSIRNRYWLIENLLNAQMKPIREASYQYHLQGLDHFLETPEEARKMISESIQKILKVNQSRPRSILTISFLDAKTDELSQIFSKGDPSLRKRTYNMLVNIDATKRSDFAKMIK